MSHPLEIENVWLIECWRCTNWCAEEGPAETARKVFADLGWKRGGEGFQTCPQCNGGKP